MLAAAFDDLDEMDAVASLARLGHLCRWRGRPIAPASKGAKAMRRGCMFCSGVALVQAAYSAGEISYAEFEGAIDRLFNKTDRVAVIHSAYRRRKR